MGPRGSYRPPISHPLQLPLIRYPEQIDAPALNVIEVAQAALDLRHDAAQTNSRRVLTLGDRGVTGKSQPYVAAAIRKTATRTLFHYSRRRARLRVSSWRSAATHSASEPCRLAATGNPQNGQIGTGSTSRRPARVIFRRSTCARSIRGRSAWSTAAMMLFRQDIAVARISSIVVTMRSILRLDAS